MDFYEEVATHCSYSVIILNNMKLLLIAKSVHKGRKAKKKMHQKIMVGYREEKPVLTIHPHFPPEVQEEI